VKARITPSCPQGSIKAPPSKSMAHRLLICAGLCPGGESRISGIELSEDILATIDCLRAMGAECSVQGDCVTVRGTDPLAATAGRVLRCRESGSTLRFFIPIALLSREKTGFEGTAKLLSRPLGVYEDICSRQGLLFERKDSITLQGRLSAGLYTLPGDVSSQFVSGLLFALPLLEADSELRLIPPVESRSYIDLTLSALRDFGVEASWTDECTISIPGSQCYKACSMPVEGDWSNAAFLSALGIVSGDVTALGLREDSLQGDRVYRQHLEALKGGFADISLADCPDLGPVLFAVAAALSGAHFTNTRRLRIKESDRVQAMAEELAKFGVRLEISEDEVTVLPGDMHAPREALWGHNDHRIVMSMAVLLTRFGGVIEGAQAVRKSWPGFFHALRALGVDLELEDD